MMKSNSETRVNEATSERPIFNEPISADAARRQLDRRILESHDSNQERIRSISSRQTRIEVVLENVQKDLRRLEEQQGEMVAQVERIAVSMNAISNKLAIHTEMEEYQWQVVNQANESIEKVGKLLDKHLNEAGVIYERVAWIEKLFFLFVTVFGVMGFVIMSDEIIARFFGG